MSTLFYSCLIYRNFWYADFSDEMLKLLLLALEDLKQLLKDQGSDLLVAFGSAEDVIRKLVNEVATQGLL